MYKLNKKLASHLHSLSKVFSFAETSPISVRIGLLGGRYFKINIDGKNYSFRLNDLIQHVYKLFLRTSDEQKGDLSNIVTRLKALNAMKPTQKMNCIQKCLHNARSNWGKKHFDREIYFKAMENQVIDGAPVGSTPNQPELSPFFFTPSPSELGTILKDRAERKKIQTNAKTVVYPEEMVIPKAGNVKLDDLCKLLDSTLLPSTLSDDGQSTSTQYAKEKIKTKVTQIAGNQYTDAFNKICTHDKFIQAAKNILKHLTEHFKTNVTISEDYPRASLEAFKGLKKLQAYIESISGNYSNGRTLSSNIYTKIDELRQLVNRIQIPSQVVVDGKKFDFSSYDTYYLLNFYSIKYTHTDEDVLKTLDEHCKALAPLASDLTRIKYKIPFFDLVKRLNESFSHCIDRLATEFEDLYFDYINLPKILRCNNLAKAIPLYLYKWRRDAIQAAGSIQGDDHNAATFRAVRKYLGDLFGVPPELSDKGENYEKFAKEDCLGEATDKFTKEYFTPYEICKNFSQLLEDNQELRKQFLEWCKKETFEENEVVNEGKIQLGYILFYLIKNRHLDYVD